MPFYRFDGPRIGGKFKSVSKPKSRVVWQETYRGWRLVVTETSVGLTVRHKQYRSSIENQTLEIEKAFTGFGSVASAAEAARRWIDRDDYRKHYRRIAQIVRSRPESGNL